MSEPTQCNKTAAGLSLHDSEILTCIFSSEQPLGSDDITSETVDDKGIENSSNDQSDPPSDVAKRFIE